MAYEILDPIEFTSGGLFRQEDFIGRVELYDWARFSEKQVLVRGCSTVFPPWAFMYLAVRLVPHARSIRYGNEHDHILVYRRPKSL
ncbi:MAG: DUF2480 family protein [Candidatus Zixiibacteriota bacterium]